MYMKTGDKDLFYKRHRGQLKMAHSCILLFTGQCKNGCKYDYDDDNDDIR